MTASIQSAPSASRRAVLARRIRLFAAATITYNVIEAAAALWAGGEADSSALIGFGPDSVIEVASALALSWQFSAEDPERREQLTLRIIAVSFFALAAFVAGCIVAHAAEADELDTGDCCTGCRTDPDLTCVRRCPSAFRPNRRRPLALLATLAVEPE